MRHTSGLRVCLGSVPSHLFADGLTLFGGGLLGIVILCDFHQLLDVSDASSDVGLAPRDPFAVRDLRLGLDQVLTSALASG
jgi:hypothetical protein